MMALLILLLITMTGLSECLKMCNPNDTMKEFYRIDNREYCLSGSKNCRFLDQCTEDQVMTTECKCIPKLARSEDEELCSVYRRISDTATPACIDQMRNRMRKDYCMSEEEECAPSGSPVYGFEMTTFSGQTLFADQIGIESLDTEKTLTIDNPVSCSGNQIPDKMRGSVVLADLQTSNHLGSVRPRNIEDAEFFCLVNKTERLIQVKDRRSGCVAMVSCVKSVLKTLMKRKEELKAEFCKTCWARCKNGVVEAKSEDHKTIVEICSPTYCSLFRESPQIVEHKLSTLDRSSGVKVLAKFYDSNSIEVKELSMQCEKEELCSTISCVLCWEIFLNPRCIPEWFSILVIIGCVIGLFIFYVILGVLIRAAKVSKECCRFCTLSVLWCCSKAKRMRRLPSEMRRKMRRDVYGSKRASATMPLVILSLVGSTSGLINSTQCTDFNSLTFGMSDCSPVGGNHVCSTSSNLDFRMPRPGFPACVNVMSSGEVAAMFKITLKKYDMVCQKSTMYHTRDFQMTWASVRRCSGSGSCYDGADSSCSSVGQDDKISEIGDFFDTVGITGCVPGCGCSSCGCFFCTPSCVFYRLYPKANNGHTYEVFKCSEWLDVVTLVIEKSTGSDTSSQEVHLTRHVSSEFKGLSLLYEEGPDLTAPVLSSTFVMRSDGLTMLSTVSGKGLPTAGAIGSLQCHTAAAAQVFSKKNCLLAPDICSCSPVTDKLSCQCPNVRLDAMMKSGERLPYTLSNGILRIKRNLPTLELSERQKVRLTGSLKSGLILPSKPRSSCTGSFIKVEGCFECESGAKLTYTCSSQPGSLDALVECDDGTKFVIGCENGPLIERSVRFNTAHRNIKTKCTAQCPEGGFTDYISVLLDYAPLNNYREMDISSSYTGAKSWEWSELLTAMWLRNLSWGLLGALVIGIFIALWCLGKVAKSKTQ